MTKNAFVLGILLLGVVACGGKKATGQEAQAEATATTSAYSLDSLLRSAEDLVGQTVTVRGFVTHTCKHSGRRCFIVGEDQKVSMRVEAKGEIGGFNRELIGSELAITGVLRENKLSKEAIDKQEETLNEQKALGTADEEACDASLSNLRSMREWMKENNKDYYGVYYMDGESYEVIEDQQ